MTKMCQGLSVTRSLLKIGGHWVKVGKNGGLSVKASEKKVGSFWWHMARNPKLSAPGWEDSVGTLTENRACGLGHLISYILLVYAIYHVFVFI